MATSRRTPQSKSLHDERQMTKKTSVTIYHNQRCSKSRQTLAILNSRLDCDVEVIEYLKSPPSADQLKLILSMLDMKPLELMRRNESVFRSENLDQADLDNDHLVTKMIEHPILIERPIVVVGNQARIGRPPEQVLELL